MRRINRRLVLLLFVLACDVVSVFGRPQEQNTFASQLKDDVVNRYTAVATATPKSSGSVESYLNTSKTQYTRNVADEREEDTRHAEPDPSLRPFFQFLLNSTTRKKRNRNVAPSDGRLVQDFISHYHLYNRPSGPTLLVRAPPPPPSYDDDDDDDDDATDTQYLPVHVYTNVPKPKPARPSGPVSGSVYTTVAPGAHKHWQESPLIFPDGNKTPAAAGPSGNSHYDAPAPAAAAAYYDVPSVAPTFVTPLEGGQGPTFVTPISVGQTQVWDGRPPPEIVILEDIDTGPEPPQSDPVVEQDPAAAAGPVAAAPAAGAAGPAAAAAGAAGAAAAAAAAAGAGGVAAAVAGVAAAGISGGSSGGVGAGGAQTPADQVQCRASSSKVCSELITTSSSPAGSGSTSFLDRLISLFTSLSFIGPLTLTFWSMMFPPMSIILTSGIGVVSFLFPWMLPRIWFGRQLGQTLFNTHRSDGRFDDANNWPYYP